MKTVILAGGYGTRIRDVSSDIPKPMIPIGDHPILWHIMKGYARYNVKDFILCLGYKGDVIKDYFLNYENRQGDFSLNLKTNEIERNTSPDLEDWTVTFVDTGQHSLTGARVFRIKKYVENEEFFMLTYGDGVSDINIEELVAFHKSHGKLMTVTGAHPPGRFGELTLDGNQVVGFNEKPQSVDGWISAGFFVCSRGVLDYLTSNEELIFERDPIENLAKDNQVMAYKHEGFWHPMDTARDHQLLNQLWQEGKAPWKTY